MNEPPGLSDERLDNLLRMWADARTPDSSGDEDLLRAITSVVRHPDITSTPQLTSAPGFWSGLVVCAALILVTVSLTWFQPSAPRKTTVNHMAASRTELSKLWSRTSDVFGPQLNWLCDLDGELLLGVDEATATGREQDHAFVLLTVRERDTQSGNWTPIWTGRVVCPLGESVDFVSDKTHSGGTIWVQSRPDGRLVASHWLNWTKHPEISGAVDAEVASGEAHVIAEQTVNGHSIQVVQQVWMDHSG